MKIRTYVLIQGIVFHFVMFHFVMMNLGSHLSAHAAEGVSKWGLGTKASDGSVEFLATGRPSALKIRGTATGVDGNFKVAGLAATGEARFKLEGLDTGIGLRTRHMKEKYLEVAKFPEARLILSQFSLPADLAKKNGKAEGVPFEGKLSLHGVEKTVKGKVNLERKDEKMSILADFALKIADFSIPNPGYMGITVADEVAVTVKFSSPIQAEAAQPEKAKSDQIPPKKTGK